MTVATSSWLSTSGQAHELADARAGGLGLGPQDCPGGAVTAGRRANRIARVGQSLQGGGATGIARAGSLVEEELLTRRLDRAGLVDRRCFHGVCGRTLPG